MESKYVEAIKAGIIGGVILAALELISNLASLLNFIKVEDIPTGATPELTGAVMTAAAFGCCICLLYIVVLAGTGALAVRMNKGLLRDLNDAVANSAFAGAVAGLIWGVIGVILGILSPLIKPEYTSATSKLGGSLFSGICGVICCLPAALVIGAVIAIVGGAIYYEMAGKKRAI
jgi:hypothetical protein